MVIKHPTLVLSKEKCRANIVAMKRRAERHGLKFRPHFKTHQSAYIGRWFKDYNIQSCTVSSIRMAMYFYMHGWKDILLAFPVNVRALDEINYLASNARFQVLISNPDVIDYLGEGIKAKLGIKIEINTGQHRSGLDPQNFSVIEEAISLIEKNPNLQFTGFYSHPGHTYRTHSVGEIQTIYDSFKENLHKLKDHFSYRYPKMDVTVGDTPGCSTMEVLSPITEISPGNFVFYDLMQLILKSCQFDQLAVAMACPVVDVNVERRKVIIHGGAVHFSKEFLETEGQQIFAQVLKMNGQDWVGLEEKTYLKSISQEHGIIGTSNREWLKSVGIGDIVYLMPAHSCLTADLMGKYRLTSGAWIPGKRDS